MFKNFKIAPKMFLAFGIAVLMLVIFCISTVYRFNSIMDKYGAVIGGANAGPAIAKQLAKVDAYTNRIILYTIILTVVVCILLLIEGGLMISDIKNRIVVLKKVSDSLARGNVNVDIPADTGKDEIAMLSRSLKVTVKKLKNEAAIANSVAEGDLTLDVQPTSNADVLGMAFKKLVDENNGFLGKIKESFEQVDTGAQQVAIASQSLAQGSTEQASAIEQVTSSIDDITSHTQDTAQNADRAHKLVTETKDTVEKGNARMTQLVSAMKEINDSSENISKIIKTIDDIAFQTNILALNAAVEAARAGEQGKGFAVVAEEVRNLAAKSAAAASETAEMIEDSIGKVHNGSQLAQSTAEELNEIVTDIENIVVLIKDIDTASNEQAEALSQVDQAVMQVSTVVQTNSATSEECAAASEELSNQADNLKEIMDRYRLKGFSNSSSSSSSISSKKSEAKRIPSASDYSDDTDYEANERIISLEDDKYSKY